MKAQLSSTKSQSPCPVRLQFRTFYLDMGTKSKVAQATSSKESDDGTGAIGGCARKQVWGRSAGGAVRRKVAQSQAALRGRKDEEGRGSDVQQEESDSSHGGRGLF